MINESVKEKIEAASIAAREFPEKRKNGCYDTLMMHEVNDYLETTFINGAEFGYQLASEENHSKRAHELEIRCANLEKSYRENYPATVKMAREPLEKEIARLKEKLDVAVKALEYFEGEKKITYCQTATGVHQIETYPANDFLKQIRDDKDKI